MMPTKWIKGILFKKNDNAPRSTFKSLMTARGMNAKYYLQPTSIISIKWNLNRVKDSNSSHIIVKRKMEMKCGVYG